MKKFLLTITAYIALLVSIIIVVNTVYINLPTAKIYEWGVEKFNTVPQNIQVCNLGSSHGEYGFDYSDLEYTGFNFGLSSQTLSYDYRVLMHYGKQLEKGCVVFIPVSYFSFYGIPETQMENFESKNMRYYMFLPKELIKEYNTSMMMKSYLKKWVPSLTAHTGLIKAVILAVSSRGVETSPDIQVATDIDLEKEVFKTVQRHILENRYNSDGNHIIIQEELKAFYKIVDLCKENGWRPIAITTPFLTEYVNEVERVKPEFLDEFYLLLNDILKDAQVEYYDYSRDERFCSNYDLFFDDDHLNENGAKKFTEILINQILENSENICN